MTSYSKQDPSTTEGGEGKAERIPVIRFYLPNGAGETLTRLFQFLDVRGPDRDWRVIGVNAVGVVTAEWYSLDTGERRQLTAAMVSWYKRGDNEKALVVLQVEDADSWRAGGFHKLLNDVAYLWPDTIPDIEKSIGYVERTQPSEQPSPRDEGKAAEIQERAEWCKALKDIHPELSYEGFVKYVLSNVQKLDGYKGWQITVNTLRYDYRLNGWKWRRGDR